MVRVLVALALVIGTVQCAAACTPISSGCPHHKHAPATRCTELIPATPAQPFALFLTEAVETPLSAAPPVVIDLEAVDHESPPGPHPKSPFILRI
jgi:hypothetical protein